MTWKTKGKASLQVLIRNVYRGDFRLIFCSFVPVGLEDYVSYFVKNFDDFVYLKWKFPHRKGSISSVIDRYHVGRKIEEKRLFACILAVFGKA